MIWCCYFCKKRFWVWAMGTLFLYKLGQKIVIFRGFSNWIPIKVININRILKHISLLTAQKNQSGCGL